MNRSVIITVAAQPKNDPVWRYKAPPARASWHAKPPTNGTREMTRRRKQRLAAALAPFKEPTNG